MYIGARLVEEVLVIADDLDADHVVRAQVNALHRTREGARTEVIDDLIASRDDSIGLWRIAPEATGWGCARTMRGVAREWVGLRA